MMIDNSSSKKEIINNIDAAIEAAEEEIQNSAELLEAREVFQTLREKYFPSKDDTASK